MHELSLCGAIVDTVNENAAGRSVRQVNLTIGHFRQVIPDTLQFCWDMRVKDTPLEDCVLAITQVPAVIECTDCGASTTLQHPILRCGGCDSTAVTMTSGEEFLIESIDLKTEQSNQSNQSNQAEPSSSAQQGAC